MRGTPEALERLVNSHEEQMKTDHCSRQVPIARKSPLAIIRRGRPLSLSLSLQEQDIRRRPTIVDEAAVMSILVQALHNACNNY